MTTPKRRANDRLTTIGVVKTVGAICTVFLMVFGAAWKVSSYYKEKEIKPMVETMIDEKVGPMSADVKVMFLYQDDMVQDDSIAKKKWNNAIRRVNKLFPEYAVEE